MKILDSCSYSAHSYLRSENKLIDSSLSKYKSISLIKEIDQSILKFLTEKECCMCMRISKYIRKASQLALLEKYNLPPDSKNLNFNQYLDVFYTTAAIQNKMENPIERPSFNGRNFIMSYINPHFNLAFTVLKERNAKCIDKFLLNVFNFSAIKGKEVFVESEFVSNNKYLIARTFLIHEVNEERDDVFIFFNKVYFLENGLEWFSEEITASYVGKITDINSENKTRLMINDKILSVLNAESDLIFNFTFNSILSIYFIDAKFILQGQQIIAILSVPNIDIMQPFVEQGSFLCKYNVVTNKCIWKKNIERQVYSMDVNADESTVLLKCYNYDKKTIEIIKFEV